MLNTLLKQAGKLEAVPFEAMLESVKGMVLE
jgi:hypothetical protein